MVFIEVLISCIGGYIIYKQEAFESSISRLKEDILDVKGDLIEIKKALPKRITDRIFGDHQI